MFHADDWLGAYLGKPAYQWRGSSADWQSNADIAGPALLSVKVPTEEAAWLLRLQEEGYRVIDTNVQLCREALPLAGCAGSVRFAEEGDEVRVRAIAREAFRANRFYRDPLIPDEIAGRIKADWAGNFFCGKRGDWLVVAEADGQVAGFLLLIHGRQTDRLILDLIAVDARFRGQSHAVDMVAFAANHCLDAPTVMQVGTQLGNIASLRLYDRLDFRLQSSAYQMHRHLGPEST